VLNFIQCMVQLHTYSTVRYCYQYWCFCIACWGAPQVEFVSADDIREKHFTEGKAPPAFHK